MSRVVIWLFVLCTCLAKQPLKIEIPGQGTIVGTEMSMVGRAKRIRAFLGIPYAQPPLGNLRFSPPVVEPLPSWDGERYANETAPACLQSSRDNNPQDMPFLNMIYFNKTYTMDEDCLYLNVYAPLERIPEAFATVVWIHPGNFTTGNPSMWNPHYLVYKYKIIVVTIAFRLGLLGFFSSLDGEAPGNFGLMDQQAAMAWVRGNIHLFGGNSKNICLMGYGSGAISVGLHMVNQQSSAHFDKAIAMSGNFLNPHAVKQPQKDAPLLKKITDLFACYLTPSSLMMTCLREAEASYMVELASNIISWRPLLDNGLSNSSLPFLTDYPKALYEAGLYHKVPFLVGYTDMEDVLNLFGGNEDNTTTDDLQRMFEELLFREVPSSNASEPCITNSEFVADSISFFYTPSTPVDSVSEYRRLIVNFTTERNYASSSLQHASYLSKYNSTYVYRFDLKPSTSLAVDSIPDWVTVPHLYDLIFIWGIPYWGTLPNGQQDWDNRDRKNSETITNLWMNFVKHGDPTKNNAYNIKWEPFTEDDPRILIINGSFSMSNNDVFNYKAVQFWNEYYPKVLEAAQCCNGTESGNSDRPSRSLIAATFLMSFHLLTL